ncbi:hypothetical protein [uncultured Photobacterium sp.]|uniref:hypothetical protein n=1 Tax=uncultured Photobacterium sp. TaxID=173973 RepID=UPI00262B8F25|nr:hypothetical protein [uncultured Photobacterium sp.]
MSKEINDKQYLWKRFIKKRDEFIAHHSFKTASELPFPQDRLANLVELNKIISVEIDGQLKFPAFQFNSQGNVYGVLQAHLPRLLNSGRSGWDICFWLHEEFGAVMKTVRADARLLRGISLDEVLRIGAIAGRLEETRIAMPIDLITTNDKEAFAAFIEQLLNPDYRDIPVKDMDWNAYFDDPGNKLDND